MFQKKLFQKQLAAFSIILALLPFLVAFSALLTEMFERFGWYVWIQNMVVPFEAKLLTLIIGWLNIKGSIVVSGHVVIMLEKEGGQIWPAVMQWNCLGWQSMVFLGLTFATGLSGNWNIRSKLEAIVLGVVGTFLINLLRMVLITVLIYYVNRIAANVLHDYLAVFVSAVWMMFFWWFSYSYILESKGPTLEEEETVIA